MTSGMSAYDMVRPFKSKQWKQGWLPRQAVHTKVKLQKYAVAVSADHGTLVYTGLLTGEVAMGHLVHISLIVLKLFVCFLDGTCLTNLSPFLYSADIPNDPL
jgi:hypothetical protein